MKNKGFTLVELLVVVSILVVVGALVLGGVRSCQNGVAFFDAGEEYYYPEAVHARVEEEQAQELRRANDLKERELNLREAEINKVEK